MKKKITEIAREAIREQRGEYVIEFTKTLLCEIEQMENKIDDYKRKIKLSKVILSELDQNKFRLTREGQVETPSMHRNQLNP